MCLKGLLTVQQCREAPTRALNQLQRNQRGTAADASQLEVMGHPRWLWALLMLEDEKERADLLRCDLEELICSGDVCQTLTRLYVCVFINSCKI